MELSPYDGLKVTSVRTAKYTTKCQITPDHVITEGSKFGLVFPVEGGEALGFGCESCLHEITEAIRLKVRSR